MAHVTFESIDPLAFYGYENQRMERDRKRLARIKRIERWRDRQDRTYKLSLVQRIELGIFSILIGAPALG